MAELDISTQAIDAFLASLPKSTLENAPETHLPSSLPLSFPTPLHDLNLLATLHLINAIFSQPQHRAFFAEINSSPSDTALRGVLGLYLASDAEWKSSNFLSATAWANGELSEAKISEFFEIQVMRESDHESLPGVKVGERWKAAVAVADDLSSTLQKLGAEIQGDSKCLGERVIAALQHAKSNSDDAPEPALAFAVDFCSNAAHVAPVMADTYPRPHGTVLPAAPLCLLQDLAAHFGPTHADFPLPEASALANVSPLPLPLPLLLHLGVLQPESHLTGGAELRHATGDWWSGKKADIFALPPKGSQKCKTISVPRSTLDALQTASVAACREFVTQARAGRGGEEWKKGLTEVDVSRIAASLEHALEAHGMGVKLTVEEVYDGEVTVEEAE